MLTRAPMRGMTMIEVLIALALLSLAIVGQIRLQVFSLSVAKDADNRTLASMMAGDLADRMRANREGFNLGSYTLSAGTDRTCAATHYNHVHAAPVTCTPAQMADDDLADWRARMAARLPGGEGVACRDSTPADGTSAAAHACDGLGTTTVIKVWWTGKPATSVTGQLLTALPARHVIVFNP